MSDSDEDRTQWDDGEQPSRYGEALSEYEAEPEYKVSSDPAGVRGHAVGGRPIWPWLLVALLVVLAAWAWVELRSSEDGSDEVPLRTADVGEPPEELAPAVEAGEDRAPMPELPPLDASDELVAEMVAALSAHPEVSRYLVGEGLVRRFAATVDNIAEGTSPRPHLAALSPQSGFTTSEADDIERPSPEAYRRYDRLAAIFVSMDTEGTAELYRGLRPLIDEAHRDLGYPDSEFDDTLRTAIDHLLATPTVPAAAEVRPRGIGRTFEYADERYESLSPAQKHLLRMGPDNVRRVQRKLRELRAALGL